MKFFDHLLKIDLEMMNKLDIRWNFEDQRKINLFFSLSATIFYIGSMLVVLLTISLRQEGSKIFYYHASYWIAYLVPLLFSCLRYYQIINCVWLIKMRLEILNKRLSNIGIQDEVQEKQRSLSIYFELFAKEMKSSNRLKKENFFDQLLTFRQIYDKLYVSSTIINYSFGNIINH